MPTLTAPASEQDITQADDDGWDGPAATLTTAGGSSDAVRDYLRLLGRTPLLTAAQEVELARRIEAGVLAQERLQALALPASARLARELMWLVADGNRAKDHLVRANLRLVVSIAKRHVGRGLAFLDLIQEGNTGLIRAMEKFDYTKGYKFSTYATWWIKQAVTRALADQSRTIRIPVHMVEQMNKVGRIRRELALSRGREATLEEVAAECGLAPERIARMDDQCRQPFSLHTPLAEAGGELGDLVVDADAGSPAELAELRDCRAQVVSALATLDEQQRQVLGLLYGLAGPALTATQAAVHLNLLPARVRYLEATALKRLRALPATAELRIFLG